MDFYSHLSKYLDEATISELKESLLEKDCHAVLLNPHKMDDETFLSMYPHVKKHPLVDHAYLFDKDEYHLGKTIWHELGCFYIQEPSAMIVSSLLDFSKDDLILDMCAAPGGKTIQAAFKNNNHGLIIANDLSKPRAGELSNNIERLGIGNVIVTNNDLSLISYRYENTFDKIILDAPCSGSGMFRKNAKMENDWSYNKVLKFAELQKQLIVMAYSMLKPGGILSYSTCSFSYEEDEEIIEYLLEKENAKVIPAIDSLYVFKGKYGFHIFPYMFNGEGHYICQIQKPGEIVPSKLQSDLNQFSKYMPNRFSGWNIKKYGDYLFGLKYNFDTKYFNVVRYGIKIGELIKDFIRYDLHFARFVNNEIPYVELDEKEVKSYLAGNQINKATNIKGMILLKYNGISVDIGKTDGQIIKNHYPKGLRKTNFE